MRKGKRFLSLLLSTVIFMTIAPWSSIKTSASFTGALQFDANGKFTIMQVADLQTNTSVPSRVVAAISNNINRYHPDLVVFTGDNIYEGISSASNFQSAVNSYLAPLLSTNTKFCVTFGNHDSDGSGGSLSSQYAYFASKGGNLFVDHDVTALTGDASGVIPIYPYGQSSGTPGFDVYVMDSGHSPSSGSYDGCYMNQVDYYIQRSQTYPDVPSIWFQHVIVPDIYTRCMTTSGSGTSYSGKGSPFSSSTYYINQSLYNASKSSSSAISDTYKEAPCPPNQAVYEAAEHRSSAAYGSKTLYEAWRDYGNLKGAYFGHDHLNEFTCTTTDGIDLGYGESTTLYKTLGIISYNDDNPGCSIYQLDIDGTYTNTYSAEGEIAKAMVAYDANGGLGTMKEQLVTKSSSVTLTSNAFTRTGYTFSGWNTKADGTGTYYANGATFTVGTSDITLYAQWAVSSVNITFNANGGTGGTGPTAMTPGAALSAPTVTRTGYAFTGWSPAVPATVPAVDTTYTAQWAIQTYTLSFNANGGSGSMSSLTDSGLGVTVPSCTFTRTGYTYSGWNTASDGSGTSYTSGTLIHLTGNLTLYAQWIANTYTIAYDPNGGSGSTASSSHTYGVAKNLTANCFSLTGYTFSGWNSAADGSGTSYTDTQSVVNLTTVGGATVTLYAQWIVNTYTVSYISNGGNGTTLSSYHIYSVAKSLSMNGFSRTGYTFTGWNTAANGSGTSYSDGQTVLNLTAVNGATVTLYAQWTARSVITGWDPNGGTWWDGTTSVKFTSPHYLETLLQPGPLDRIGYTFAGWSPSLPPTVPANDIIYTAQWTPNKYTITWDANGGSGSTTTSVAYGATPVPPTVIRTGYAFAGWSPEITAVTGAATYTAQWAANDYSVSFSAEGGSGSMPAQTITFGQTAALTLNAFVKTGYTFTGWAATSDGNVIYTDGAKFIMNTTGVTLYAKWSVNQYSVTFDSAGGSPVDPIMQDYDTVITVPTDPIRLGYTFGGWSPAVPATMPGNNIECVAQWVANIYTVTYDANGGTGTTANSLHTYDTASNLTENGFVKTGFSFLGWSTSSVSTVPEYSNGQSVINLTDMNAGTVTFYSVWLVNQYNVSFDANGGTGTALAVSQDYGTSVTLPSTGFTKAGYTFIGWSMTADTLEIIENYTVPANDSTLFAAYKINQYKVTFNKNGGSGYTAAVTQDFNSNIELPTTNFSKTGCTFIGWNTTPDAETALNSYSVPAYASILYAIYIPNQYTITFDANGGMGGTSGLMEYGTTLTTATVTRTGYTFTGWDIQVPSSVPAANTTYTAQWSVNSYTVTFDANGGTGGTSILMVYGTALAAPSVSRTGYTFTGWDSVVPSTVSAADTTYTAQWSINSYTITFDANGGTGGTSGLMTYGTALTAPAVSRAGYIFTGWSPAVPATVGAESAAYTALWMMLGNVNNDSVINSLDALMALKATSGKITLTDSQKSAADVNKDGKVNSLDALMILKFVSGKLTTL